MKVFKSPSNVVSFLVSETPKTVSVITISTDTDNNGYIRSLQSQKRQDFYKYNVEVESCPVTAIYAALQSSTDGYIKLTAEAADILTREIIIMSEATRVIATTTDLKFIGKYASNKLAAKLAPADSLFFSNAEELAAADPSFLAEAFTINEVTTVEELWAKFNAAEVVLPAKREKAAKKEKLDKVPRVKIADLVKNAIDNGEIINSDEFSAAHDCKPSSIALAVAALKKAGAAIKSGILNGVKCYAREDVDVLFETVTVERAPRQEKGVKTQIRELMEAGEALTIAEIVERTGGTVVTIRTALTDLKSPKYCGKGEPLNIVREGDVYSLAK